MTITVIVCSWDWRRVLAFGWADVDADDVAKLDQEQLHRLSNRLGLLANLAHREGSMHQGVAAGRLSLDEVRKALPQMKEAYESGRHRIYTTDQRPGAPSPN